MEAPFEGEDDAGLKLSFRLVGSGVECVIRGVDDSDSALTGLIFGVEGGWMDLLTKKDFCSLSRGLACRGAGIRPDSVAVGRRSGDSDGDETTVSLILRSASNLNALSTLSLKATSSSLSFMVFSNLFPDPVVVGTSKEGSLVEVRPIGNLKCPPKLENAVEILDNGRSWLSEGS